MGAGGCAGMKTLTYRAVYVKGLRSLARFRGDRSFSNAAETISAGAERRASDEAALEADQS